MSEEGTPSLAVYHEHPEWFEPLFDELSRRGIQFERLNTQNHHYDPAEVGSSFSLVLNRMSPSAFLRDAGDAIHYTSQYLAHLERLGVRVINGSRAWQVEISKAYQLSLLELLGLPYPRARVIHDAADALDAARGLRFPVVVKANVGGSGAGIRRFDTPEELAEGLGELELGLDHTALVQEFIPTEAGRIVRVEVLNGTFLYAIRIYHDGSDFNLCPADVCLDIDGSELEGSTCASGAVQNGLRVEGYTPPAEIIQQVETIMAAAGIEVGGVEYLIDERDGQLYFYDVNALSNFVADAPRIIGFDPFSRLVDWLEQELGLVPALVASR